MISRVFIGLFCQRFNETQTCIDSLLEGQATATVVHMYTYGYGQCLQPGPTGGWLYDRITNPSNYPPNFLPRSHLCINTKYTINNTIPTPRVRTIRSGGRMSYLQSPAAKLCRPSPSAKSPPEHQRSRGQKWQDGLYSRLIMPFFYGCVSCRSLLGCIIFFS
jgi:hypothetical protein